MPTLAYRAAPSLYSGMILALTALALALQASFLVGLVAARGGAAGSILGPRPAVTAPASGPASSPAPCAVG